MFCIFIFQQKEGLVFKLGFGFGYIYFLSGFIFFGNGMFSVHIHIIMILWKAAQVLQIIGRVIGMAVVPL